MKQNALIFSLIFLLTISYSFISYSQNKERERVIGNCQNIKDNLNNRKNYLLKSIIERKQNMSDIKASLEKMEQVKNLDLKKRENLNKFYEETDLLILEREDLVIKIDNLLILDCNSDKKAYLTKLNIFNNNFKAHLKKELGIREEFEEDIYFNLSEQEK